MSEKLMPLNVRTLEQHGISLEMLAATTDKRQMEEAVKNANLIAAAPELYEELKNMIGCFGEIAGDTADAEEREREEEIVRQARDALAKARGEQEEA